MDCCITKAPCGGEKAGKSPVDRGKQGIKRSMMVDSEGIPLGVVAAGANRHDSPLLAPTLEALRTLGGLPESVSVHLDRGYDSKLTRRLLEERGLAGVISERGRSAPLWHHQTLGHRTNQLLDQRPQEASVVHREARTSHRLLDIVLQRDPSSEGSFEKPGDAPLGGQAITQTLTYWRI